MKKQAILAICALLLPLSGVLAQITPINEGSVLEIVKPEGDFQHLRVPKKNIIIKQGGIPNLYSLDGNVVVVQEVQQLGDQHKVVIRRQDGGKFLRRYRTLTAYWPEALDSGELRRVN
jgi:hypothetical protein